MLIYKIFTVPRIKTILTHIRFTPMATYAQVQHANSLDYIIGLKTCTT